jgi:hypothetical protein
MPHENYQQNCEDKDLLTNTQQKVKTKINNHMHHLHAT